MKVLITGVCGFVGSAIARYLIEAGDHLVVYGIDNLARKGSEGNRQALRDLGVEVVHGDLRLVSDLAVLPETSWIIDAAALPFVLGGVQAGYSSRQIVEHNLIGTLNLLEHARSTSSGLILLSTSRVYSIEALRRIPLQVCNGAFELDLQAGASPGVSELGIAESFSTASPVSLYGATKLASETMALEYASTYGMPVWVNRCGVMAGAGQFGRPDQGVLSYWLNAHLRRRPLRYFGFEGTGHQVRDCLHPKDLARLVYKQMTVEVAGDRPRLVNVGGGMRSAISLRQLSQWCDDRFGKHAVTASQQTHSLDVPWIVLDASLASQSWDWQPEFATETILDEIAEHARANPKWLEQSS